MQKAVVVRTVLSSLLVICVVTLCITGLVIAKTIGINMQRIWCFDKVAVMAISVTMENIGEFAYIGTDEITSAILAIFAIAPWAYVGFDVITQVSEEFIKKVSFIMMLAIVFGCFVYISNNTVIAAVLTNWPNRIMAGSGSCWG